MTTCFFPAWPLDIIYQAALTRQISDQLAVVPAHVPPPSPHDPDQLAILVGHTWPNLT